MNGNEKKGMTGIEIILASENTCNEKSPVLSNLPVYEVSGMIASHGGNYRNCQGKKECSACTSYNC
jgi:hypothetical protein